MNARNAQRKRLGADDPAVSSQRSIHETNGVEPVRLRPALIKLALVTALLFLPAVVSAEPSVIKVAKRHYQGTWLEIARTPMWLTDGCVAGYTTYRPGSKADQIMVEDGCYEGRPGGRLKTVSGWGTLLDPDTTRAKLRV